MARNLRLDLWLDMRGKNGAIFLIFSCFLTHSKQWTIWIHEQLDQFDPDFFTSNDRKGVILTY